LKRLVPRAIERELSEKLEKADILRLTVDYLKTPEKNSDLDYKEMGFRDCISEISKFFLETDSLQAPIHQRMLAHLQYFTSADSQTGVSGDGDGHEMKRLRDRILFNAAWLHFVEAFCGDSYSNF